MNVMNKIFAPIVVLVCATLGLFTGIAVGQTSYTPDLGYISMPKVFKLGEHAQQYENLTPGYQTLLEACGGDMKVAHAKLHSMMKEMEAFASLMDYDLKGIKAWMHFFWKEDGTIEHIGFYLKPNSRNVDSADLGAFLKNFSQHYDFPLSTDLKYAHYSTFSFPVF